MTANATGVAMAKNEHDHYRQGYLDGLEAFAHMKDGVTYVGTSGYTLKRAKEEPHKLWNWNPPALSQGEIG